MKYFSQLGENIKKFKSLGVELSLHNSRVLLKKVFNDEYIENDKKIIFDNYDNFLDNESYQKNHELSTNEIDTIKKIYKHVKDKRPFFGAYYNENGHTIEMTRFYEKDTNILGLLSGNIDLSKKYEFTSELLYQAKHDLYHLIESHGQTPHYVIDSNRVIMDLDIPSDINSFLIYKNISGINAVSHEFTTAFCELQVFDIEKIYNLTHAIKKVIDTGKSQFISLLSDSHTIHNIMKDNDYINYKELVKKYINYYSNNQNQVIKEINKDIIKKNFNTINDLYKSFNISITGLSANIDTKEMIAIIYKLVSHLSMINAQKERKTIHSKCHNLSMRFAFLDNEEALGEFYKLVQALQKIEKNR